MAPRAVWLAACLIGLAAGPAPGCGKAPPLSVPADATGVWFGEVAADLDARSGDWGGDGLDDADAAALLAAVRGALNGRDMTASERVADTRPRVLLLSARTGAGPAVVAVGAGRGWMAAATDAVDRLRPAVTSATSVSSATSASSAQLSPNWLRLDVVVHVERVDAFRWDADAPALADDHRPGFSPWGLALPRGTGIALLAEEIAGRELVRRGELSRRRTAAYLDRSAAPRTTAFGRQALDYDGPIPAWRFATRAWVHESRTAVAPVVTPVERPGADPPRLDAAALLAAARAGGDYLARATGADGAFAYSYLAYRDRVRDSYNMVRHAGTAYAMLELYRVTGDAALLTAAERALGYLLRFTEPWSEDPSARVVAYGGKIKLGGVALAALALAEHVAATGDQRHLAAAQGLCRYIALSQAPDGSFVHQRAHPGGQQLPFVSRYYPGEAILALMRVHAIDGDPTWLDAAERGARYLIEVRDRGLPVAELDHDHWLLYGLSELYRTRPTPLFLDHAARISQAILGAQRMAPPRIRGGFSNAPRSAPVATRVEGLMAAHALLRDAPDAPHTALAARSAIGDIRAAAERAVALLLAMQIGPELAPYTPNPGRSLGALPRSADRLEVRIDYVQHAISAMLGLRRAIRAQAASPAAQPAPDPRIPAAR